MTRTLSVAIASLALFTHGCVYLPGNAFLPKAETHAQAPESASIDAAEPAKQSAAPAAPIEPVDAPNEPGSLLGAIQYAEVMSPAQQVEQVAPIAPIAPKVSEPVVENTPVAQASPAVEELWITPQLVSGLQPKVVMPHLNAQLEQELQRYEYRVGAGDMLSFSVWGHPEISSTPTALATVAPPVSAVTPAPRPAASQPTGGTLVHRDGTIFFPYVGVLKVDGLSLSELRRKLTHMLDKYIQYPQVDVSVIGYESQKVYITGEVNNVGPLPITSSPLTLLDAVSRVGGFKVNADLRNVVLIRDGQENIISLADLLQKGDFMQNRLLKHGDLLYFPSNTDNKVFVLGEVDKRNVLPLGTHGTSLAEALAASGGINVITAKPTGVFVLRSILGRDSNNPRIQVFQLDASEPTAYVLADRFPLQPRDFIYVTAAPITLWNRVLNQLLPSISSLLLIDNINR